MRLSGWGRTALGLVLAAAMVAVGCSPGEDSSDVDATGPSVVEEPTGTDLAGSSADGEAETAESETTTTESETAASTTTTGDDPDDGATPESLDTSSRPGRVVGVVLDDGDYQLVGIDVATGERTELFSTFLEAAWLSVPVLDADGSGVYMMRLVEDYWFSCESSVPELVYVEFSTGELTTIGRGAYPEVSPDGDRLAYVTASDCLPDPADPGNWVVTVLDTVVVRDLATGAETQYTDPTLADDFTAAGGEAQASDFDLAGVVWTGDGHLIAGDQRLAVGATIEFVNRTNRSIGKEGRVVGYDPKFGMVLLERPNGNVAELVGFDEIFLDEIGVQATVSPPEEWFGGAFALDRSGSWLATLDNGVLAVGGEPVEFASADDLVEIEW